MDWLASFTGFLSFDQFASRWMLLLMDGALKATLIVMLGGLVTVAMRSASAAARHAVWAIAIGSILLIPLISTMVPQWNLGLFRTPLSTVSDVSVVPLPRVSAVTPVPSRSPSTAPPAADEAALEAPVANAPVPTAAPRGRTSFPVPAASPALGDRPSLVVKPIDQVPADAGHGRRGQALTYFLTGLWTIGMVGVMATLLGALFRVHRLERSGRVVTDPSWSRLVRSVARDMGIVRPIGLMQSSRVRTPATWGFARPVVMIPDDADSWAVDRRRDVIVHELAHVKRYDFLTQMMARYACAVFWFNPLVWLAARQLRVERERSCDDAVLASGTKASAYAGHLLEIARSIKGPAVTSFAAVSMAQRSQLTGRLLAVLEDGRNRGSLSRRGMTLLWLGAVVLLTPVLGVTSFTADAAEPRLPAPPPLADVVPAPAPSMTPAGPMAVAPPRYFLYQQQLQWASAPECLEAAPGSDNRGTQSNSNNDRYSIRWWDGDCEGDLVMRGEVTFTPDFTDVASIASRGRFSLEIDADGDSRRVEITPSGSSLSRRWFVDGDEQPYGSEAQTWLALALEDLFRHSSVALDERVDYLLSTRGVAGLIEQAGLSHGSYLTARYYGAAIETGQLQTSDIDRILQRATREITSDFEMARLLTTIPANDLRDPSLRRAYIQASNTIESDFEKRRVLTALLQQPSLDTEVVSMLLSAAQDLDSDFELATLLTEIGPRYLNVPATRELYLQAAQSIQSDFELRRTLTALLQRDDLGRENLRLLLQAATTIDSDFEAASLLIQVAQKYVVDESLRTIYFESVHQIGSDFEKRRVLNALLQSDSVQTSLVPEILNSGSTIGSDFELAELLSHIATNFDLTSSMRPVFFRAVSTVDSDFEHQRILQALISRDGLPTEMVTEAIRSTAGISSDFSKATVLRAIASKYRNDEGVRTALEEAADTISSDHEYGRVMAAIRGRPERP